MLCSYIAAVMSLCRGVLGCVCKFLLSRNDSLAEERLCQRLTLPCKWHFALLPCDGAIGTCRKDVVSYEICARGLRPHRDRVCMTVNAAWRITRHLQVAALSLAWRGCVVAKATQAC